MAESSLNLSYIEGLLIRGWRLFARAPVWMSVIGGLLCYIPDTESRVSFWLRVVSAVRLPHSLAQLLGSPYAGSVLIAFGVLYFLFANHRSEQNQVVLPPIGSPARVHEIGMPIRELFAHIHPLPFHDDADRENVGRAVIDEIASANLGIWGRRIDGSKRLALEPIPHQVFARAKFTYWFLDEKNEQMLHVDCPVDASGSASRQYADLRVDRAQAGVIWSFIPLKDAARIVYERARESITAKAAEAEGGTPDGILLWFAQMMFIYTTVYAQRPPSTVRETVPVTTRGHMRVLGDCSSIGTTYEKLPTYTHPTIAGMDLEAFISWAKSGELFQVEAPTE
jgi:hypothetical protein